MRSRIIGILTVLSALAAAGPARADIYDYHWTWYDDAGGGGTYNRVEMDVFGGNVGVGGSTSFTATAKVGALILFDYTYSSPDSGQYDYAFFQVNGGQPMPIVDNDHQGSGTYGYTIGKGDTFTIGVITADGQAGAGTLQVFFNNYGTLVAKSVTDFNWHSFETPGTGNGFAYIQPPYDIHVTGTDNGHPNDDQIFTAVESPVIFYVEGTYLCKDHQGDDEAYWTMNAYGEQVFINDETQGAWSFMDVGLFKGPNDFFGLGVRTNGQGAPGILDTTNFFTWVYTHQIEDVPWQPYTDSGGSVDLSHIGDRYIQIFGGIKGVTEIIDQQAGTEYLVQAVPIFTWQAAGDMAYYRVNNKVVTFGDFDHQGAIPVEFHVRAGDSFAFGISTNHKNFNAGNLVIDDYRAFPDNPVPPDCYPDFTLDGTLDLFDFLSYLNTFNGGNQDADCDHSGSLDLFDFLCFTNAFNAGC